MTRTIAYISNAESKEIFAFDMDPESGALSLLERKPVPGADLPSPTSLPMAVSPDRRFLYAALRSPPFAASSFSIDPSSGRLSHLAVAAAGSCWRRPIRMPGSPSIRSMRPVG